MSQETKFTELNFFEIKQKLITHFQNQTEFQDVNFLGSTANILVDTCAYALHQMAVHANFAISETFLDSVQKRSNALSRAKELGYSIATVSAAIMRVTVEVTGNLPGDPDILIPRFETFTASETSGGSSLDFTNLQAVTLTKEVDELGEFVDETVRKATFDIKQGRHVSRTFNFSDSEDFAKYSLTDPNIDGKTISLTVEGEEWAVYDGLEQIDPDSKIFFVQENNMGDLEFWFGDGILSKKPLDNDEIVVDYLITEGVNGNDVNTISYPAKSSNSAYSINVEANSSGGAKEHSVNRIAATAPIVFQAQKRAVTKSDYEALLKSEFSWIDTLSVWGGEDNDPPIYGRVFVSIKPRGSEELSPALAQTVEDRVLNKFNVLGIPAEITQPDYVYINLDSEVFWNPSLSRDDSATIKTSFVEPAIDDHFDANVTEFNKKMKFSKLVAVIDDSHPAISHNITETTITKKFKPTPFLAVTLKYAFRNPLVAGTFESDPISFIGGTTVTLKDNGNGQVDEYVGGNVRTPGIGTINYTTGTVVLSNYKFEVENGTQIIITAKPKNVDIEALNNSLVVLGNKNISMTRI